MRISRANQDFLIGALSVLLIASSAHLFFSNLGFNPTDDGYVLAGSRRILDGQVPHRDFITIHNAGSYFFHAPFVFLGGDYTLWISRYFVWIQFAFIAWIWTIIISQSFEIFSTWIEKFAAALIIFSFSVHNAPITAWNTTDGIFLISLGILLYRRTSASSKTFGSLLIGTAPLCKQSFLPMIPIALLILNDTRNKRYWLYAIIPIIIYAAYLAINEAISDTILQLNPHSNLLSEGIMSYITNWKVPWGLLIGLLATYIAIKEDIKFKWVMSNSYLIGIFIIFGFTAGLALSLAMGNFMSWAFASFGAAAGILVIIVGKEKMSAQAKCGILILSIAWCASISRGYGTPALASGPLILFFTAYGLSAQKKLIRRMKFNFTLISLSLIILAAFAVTRISHIYWEQPAGNLNYNIGNVLEGGNLIKTNINTFHFLEDLEAAKKIVKDEGKEYSIIPDVPANWIKSSQPNPLSIDWVQIIEKVNRELADRVIADLEKHRGSTIVIVQKYTARLLASGFSALPESFVVVNYVRSNFTKIKETQFFELYR